MLNWCCVPNCPSRRGSVKLHKFPANEDQRSKWLDCINCDKLRSLCSYDLVKTLVCHKHFEKRFCTEKSRIKSTAYPTLFSKKEIKKGIPSRSYDDKEKPKPSDHLYSRKEHYDHTYCKPPQSNPALLHQVPFTDLSNMPSTCFFPSYSEENIEAPNLSNMPSTCFSPSYSEENIEVPDLSNMPSTCFSPSYSEENIEVPDLSNMPSTCFPPSYTVENIEVPGKCISRRRVQLESHTNITTATPQEPSEDEDDIFSALLKSQSPPRRLNKKRFIHKRSKLTPKCKRMYTPYKHSRRLLKYKERAKKAVAASNSFDDLTKNMNPLAKHFFNMQVNMSAKGKRSRRFSLEDKLIALSIYKQSSKAYKYLQNFFILPSTKTLNKMIIMIN